MFATGLKLKTISGYIRPVSKGRGISAVGLKLKAAAAYKGSLSGKQGADKGIKKAYFKNNAGQYRTEVIVLSKQRNFL